MNTLNAYLITIARLSNIPSDDIYAGAAEESEIIARIVKTEEIDDESGRVRFSFRRSGFANNFDFAGPIYEDLINAQLILATEKHGLFQILEDHTKFDADYENSNQEIWWTASGDETLLPENFENDRLPNSLVISVQPYFDCEIKISENDLYGVEVSGNPDDDGVFSAICLAPSPAHLEELFNDAAKDEHSLLRLIGKYPNPKNRFIQSAYLKLQEIILDTNNIYNVMDFLRYTHNLFKDKEVHSKKLHEFNQRLSSGFYSEDQIPWGYENIGSWLTELSLTTSDNNFFQEAIEAFKESARHSCKDTDVIKRLIQDTRDVPELGGMQFAEELISIALESCPDSKTKTKIKNKAKKEMD